MTVWRRNSTIRVKAIGLAWHEGALLAAEVCDDSGRLKGVRPLSGSVEFGERWCDALIREFAEELALDIEAGGTPIVLENLFTHEGNEGHEIIFAADVHLSPDTIQGQSVVRFVDDIGAPCTARWFDLGELDVPGGTALYPSGLKDRLAASR